MYQHNRIPTRYHMGGRHGPLVHVCNSGGTAMNALTIAYLTLLIAVFRLGYDLGKDVEKRKEPPRKR